MPEVWSGFQKFHPDLGLTLHSRPDEHNLAILDFGIGDALQLQLLCLGDLSRECDQRSMRVYNQCLSFLCELPLRSLSSHRHRYAEDYTLAAPPVGVRAGSRPGTHSFQPRRAAGLAQ